MQFNFNLVFVNYNNNRQRKKGSPWNSNKFRHWFQQIWAIKQLVLDVTHIVVFQWGDNSNLFFCDDINYRVKLMLYELYENHSSNINKPDYLRLKGTHKERIVENLRTLQLLKYWKQKQITYQLNDDQKTTNCLQLYCLRCHNPSIQFQTIYENVDILTKVGTRKMFPWAKLRELLMCV